MMAFPCRSERGFSLIELLIVVGIIGIIMGAVYSLYKVQRNTAYSQVEVIEVQQNLRTALDNISRDLRLAGIMMPLLTNPIATATGTNIRINVASAEGRFARVSAQCPVGTTTTILTVESPVTTTSPNVIDGFALNDKVRIIRPVDGSQPITSNPAGSAFVITAMNRTNTGSNPYSVTIGSSGFTAGEIVVPGDMITKVADATTYPVTVDYYLVNGGTTVNGITCPTNQQCLVRQVNAAAATPGPADIIASNMTSLGFGYLDDSYAEAAVPSDLTKVRAVRVTLQGATANTTALSGGARSRALTSVIKLRNRR